MSDTGHTPLVRVKPLEWETDSVTWWVRGNGPRYEVGPETPWGCRLHYGSSRIGSHTGDWFLSPDAAKAAAQAHHERRILSAIETSPSLPILVEALREAVGCLYACRYSEVPLAQKLDAILKEQTGKTYGEHIMEDSLASIKGADNV